MNNMIRGNISVKNKIIGKLNQGIEKVIIYDGEKYEGDYVITPQVNEQQELETKNKIMIKNLTIKKVPFYEVSNEEGTTVFIGSEV